MKNKKLKEELKNAAKKANVDGGNEGMEILNPETLESINGGQQDRDVPADCADFKCGAYDNCGLK